jgi:cobalt-zinc-cadmium efflux system outer membrane protein
MPADYGRDEVTTLLAERGQPAGKDTGALLDTLSSGPLTLDGALRIALTNNPALQSTYATLGFGAADIYAAGRLRNPVIAGSVLHSGRSGERDQVMFGLVASFTDLITLPARKQLADSAFIALKQSVAAQILTVAGQTEKAYYDYVGTRQVAALHNRIARAGDLSAALASRYRDAGNINPRELALERAAASQSRLAALDAEAAVTASRTHLAQLLGISSGEIWTVPARLPLPVANEDELVMLLALANNSRLDLAAAQTQAQNRAERIGVVNWTRWLGELDIGFEREKESGGGTLSGPTLAWELPVFTQHEDALVRADVQLQIALNEVRRLTVAVDNDVRLAYAKVENARALVAEYKDVMIPQRIEAVSFGQQELNFMLIGVFELLTLKQQEYGAYQGYLEALRDYWLARVELGLATGTALPSNALIDVPGIDVDQLFGPSSPAVDDASSMNHSGHTMTNGGAK